MTSRRMPKFSDYCDAFEFIEMRREAGILEIKLHSAGESLKWNVKIHDELGYCSTAGVDRSAMAEDAGYRADLEW